MPVLIGKAVALQIKNGRLQKQLALIKWLKKN